LSKKEIASSQKALLHDFGSLESTLFAAFEAILGRVLPSRCSAEDVEEDFPRSLTSIEIKRALIEHVEKPAGARGG
jgi:hypothetical protein